MDLRGAIRIIAALVVALAWTGPSSALATRVVAGPARVPLDERSTYERYVTLDDLMDVAPDSARALAAAWRISKPGDVISAYAHSWGTLRRDSSATEAALTRAQRETTDADAAAISATLHLARRQMPEARRDFERLSRLLAGRGDRLSASWARVFRLLKEAAPSDGEAEAEVVARLLEGSVPASDRGEIALLLADRMGQRTPRLNAMRLQSALATHGAASQAARGEAQRRLGAALRADGRHDEAEAAYRVASALGDSCGWTRLSLRAWRGIASIARARGRVVEALPLTRAFADSAKALGFDEQYSEALQDLGNTFLASGRLREARAVLEERLELIRVRRWHADQRMMALDQLGGVAALEGRLDEARGHFEEALEIARRRSGHEYEPSVLLHLSNLHRDTGDDARALAMIEEALHAARTIGSRRIESMSIALKADILMDLGRREESVELAAEAARHAAAHEPRNLPMALRTWSHSLVALGRIAEAQAPIDSLRAYLALAPDTMQQGRLERSDAEVALARGDTARAIELSRYALDLARALDSREEVSAASLSLALALQSAGRLAESVAPLEAGLAHREQLLLTSASGDERSRVQRRWQAYYGDLARAYHAAGRTADAFALLEHSRAREMRAQFAGTGVGVTRHVPAELAREMGERETELATLQQVLLEEWARPPRARNAALPRLEARADSLKRGWDDLQVRVQRAAPEYARASGLAQPMTLAEVQAQLKPNELLIAYMIGWQRLLRFDVTRTDCRVHEIAGDGEHVAARIRTWVAACQNGSSEAWRAGAAALADTLLADLILPRGDAAALLIVPDGVMQTMPFEALLVRESGRRVSLLERATIVVAETPGFFFAPPHPARVSGGAGIAAFGDPLLASAEGTASERAATLSPLPHARREVESVREAFPKARLYTGAQATEPRLHEEIERASIIHVAAHGFYDDRFPRFSALAMAHGNRAGDAAADGMLQAWEVLERRGDLELVTLSACETGRGRVVGGEGLDGLSRAFRIAGARQLIASLWRVDDAATAVLMRDFYRRLAAGESVASAFRAARLTLARGTASANGASRGIGRTSERAVAAHPRVWAAFVLRGAR